MSDISINTTSIFQGSTVIQKPIYLLTLKTEDTKGKPTKEFFLALDKPDIETAYVSCKGFYVEGTEDVISVNFIDLVSKTDKAKYSHIMFPWHRVSSIKNLGYKSK